MFFNNLNRFGDATALIDADTEASISYSQLETYVALKVEKIDQSRRCLIFIEASNSIETVINYLACLRCGHVVYLLDSFEDDKTQVLIEHYQPNILLSEEKIDIQNQKTINLHPSLRLLLSTSGSTGSPKFVKLSSENIQSNASAICEYLDMVTSDRCLCHLKLHYSFGLSILNSYLLAGASIVLTSCQVNDDKFSLNINKYKVTSFSGVPYTFETLSRTNFSIENHPSLSCVTQAGGKLEAEMVRSISNNYASYGVKFYVMYGQTEASPRISYLPYDLAEQHPASIGRAIPGGTLSLVDEKKAEITSPNIQGELVYRGPNVMMGYAESVLDLLRDDTPEYLLTGDIAYFDKNGLFYITGRSKRFVKLFGIRVSLDEVQSTLKTICPHSAVTGNDKHIVVALSHNTIPILTLRSSLSEKFSLPESVFTFIEYDEIPLMVTGKYDYKAIMNTAGKSDVKNQSLLLRLKDFILGTLGLLENDWGSVFELFNGTLSGVQVTGNDTFDSLGGDSLSYVSLSVELEGLLGSYFPSDWSSLPVSELDLLYQKKLSE